MNNLNEKQNLNYEQKKNNGKGVFYGVIAVATLIVAIIGATFAYFTARTNSTEDALRATAAHVEVNYLEGRQLAATNLIPSKASVVAQAYHQKTAYQQNKEAGCSYIGNEGDPESFTEGSSTNWNCSGAKAGYTAKSTGDVGTKCVDDNGYYVCAVYQFTVTNKSNVKQALQAYMQINTNSFTTVDENAVRNSQTYNPGDATHPSNGALKFMTIRSDDTINVEVISSQNDPANCPANMSNMNQKNPSTRFCALASDTCTEENIVNTEQNDHPCKGKSVGDSYYIDDTDKVTSTDSSGSYYFFNTTAVRQSLKNSGQQTVFSGEIIPSIDTGDLNSKGAVLYMHTKSQGEGVNDTSKGTNIYADSNGYTYDSPEACNAGKTFTASCYPVFLTTSSQPNGGTEQDPDLVLGAYGQVSKTYYIVAWLEENNPLNTFNFYGGKDENDNWTGTLTQKASSRGRTTSDKLDQDDDQDASFATTIYVTSGDAENAGVTGYMNPTPTP